MRVVIEAVVEIDEVSLNSKLLKGPDENPPLTKLLFQFRQGKIPVCSDKRNVFADLS